MSLSNKGTRQRKPGKIRYVGPTVDRVSAHNPAQRHIGPKLEAFMWNPEPKPNSPAALNKVDTHRFVRNRTNAQAS